MFDFNSMLNVQFLKRECSICLTIEHHAALYFYLTSTNWPGLVTDNPLSETDGWPNLTNESPSVHQEVRQPTFTTRPNFMENPSIWSNIYRWHQSERCDRQYCTSSIWEVWQDTWLSSPTLSLTSFCLTNWVFACFPDLKFCKLFSSAFMKARQKFYKADS